MAFLLYIKWFHVSMPAGVAGTGASLYWFLLAKSRGSSRILPLHPCVKCMLGEHFSSNGLAGDGLYDSSGRGDAPPERCKQASGFDFFSFHSTFSSVPTSLDLIFQLVSTSRWPPCSRSRALQLSSPVLQGALDKLLPLGSPKPAQT